MAISSAARATMNAITPKVIEGRNVNIPRAFLDNKDAAGKSHRRTQLPAPLKPDSMSAQHQGLDRKQQGLDAQQHCVHEPTSSGIIKLGTYVIFELIIREAVEQ